MLSCEIIPYTMLLQIKFQKNPTWRQPARWLVGSAIYLRVAAKTRTKNRPAISRGKGEKDNIVLLANARHHLLAEQTPTVLSWSIYIYIYRFVSCLRRRLPRGQQVGSLLRLSWMLHYRSDGRIFWSYIYTFGV